MAVLAATSELATIRALSQYRPFEGGGASVRDAHEDLVLAALAEADGKCASIEDCHATIFALFRIDLELLSIAAALNNLTKEGRVESRDGEFHLSEAERASLETLALESQEVAAQALADWRAFVLDRAPIRSEDLDLMEQDLTAFLKAVVRRHGIEATLLLYPEAEEAQGIYAEIEKEGFRFLTATPEHAREVRDLSLTELIRHPTDAQRDYLARNLNTAYFLSVLSIDPEGGRLLTEITRGQRVYFDTNFLYRLLGVQGPRYVKPDEAILRVTQQAGYQCCITEWTLNEFKESLRRSREFLEKYPIPPGDYAAVAAATSGGDDFVTAYWKQVRGGVKLVDFFQYYAEVETHLRNAGITIESEGCTAVDQVKDDIKEEMSILERVSWGRFRHPALLEHDVKHRLLVKRLRAQARASTFSNAGYWFLTHDSTLPRYDHHAGKPGDLPYCVSAGAWFQIMEAFRPKTQDPDQSLADMLASPYVRYRRTLSPRSAVEIVARVDRFKDGTPELAARVFMNTAALEAIERAATDEERLEKIDDAIIAAAKEAQEDARQARAIAEEEKQKARGLAQEAARRADEAERQALLAVEVAKATHQNELERTRARGEEALKAEARRADQELGEERQRHAKELAEKDQRITEKEREIRTVRRRLFLGVVFVLAVVLFLVLLLAVGLDATWSVVAGISVVVGLVLAAFEFERRRHQDD